MIAMNYSTLRSHMKYAFDACCDDMETLIVTRKDNRNVVVLSEESYNNLMENLYVRASKKNYDRLLTSIAQAKAGQCKKRDLIELEPPDQSKGPVNLCFGNRSDHHHCLPVSL